jgi:hypothetical protein
MIADSYRAPPDYSYKHPERAIPGPGLPTGLLLLLLQLDAAGNPKGMLDLKEEPVLRKARIVGYTLANWGDYLTLLDGPPDNVVSGYAYMVQSDDNEQKLTTKPLRTRRLPT